MKILVGDALEMLATLPRDSVDCIVTSPPYYRQRDYGIGGQIGQEETFGEYVTRLAAVFREARSVLKPTGTLWLNIGDGYGAKQLRMAPARVVVAMQDDGWLLRSHVVWHRPNAMPESVKDRPTRAHESIFLLVRQSRYWYDAAQCRTPLTIRTMLTGKGDSTISDRLGDAREKYADPSSGRGDMAFTRSGRQRKSRRMLELGTANLRDVWSINHACARDRERGDTLHYAPFSPEIPRRCILLGCPPGGVVLDPFAGTGTTLRVALELGRQAIGIDLHPEYAALAERRTRAQGGLAL